MSYKLENWTKSILGTILQFTARKLANWPFRSFLGKRNSAPSIEVQISDSILRCRFSGNLWQISQRTMKEWKKIPKATQFSRWVINWWVPRERNLSAKWLGKFLITFQWTGKYPRYLLDLLQRVGGVGRRLRDGTKSIKSFNKKVFTRSNEFFLSRLMASWWFSGHKKPLGAKIVSCFFFVSIMNKIGECPVTCEKIRAIRSVSSDSKLHTRVPFFGQSSWVWSGRRFA